MNRTHKLTVCTPCPHKGGAPCQVGYDLISRLRSAIEMAGDSVADDFAVSGTVDMTGCQRRCHLAYHGTRDTTHVFGDVDAKDDIDALITLATEYAAADHPLRRAPDPASLPAATKLHQLPAAMITLTPMMEALS